MIQISQNNCWQLGKSVLIDINKHTTYTLQTYRINTMGSPANCRHDLVYLVISFSSNVSTKSSRQPPGILSTNKLQSSFRPVVSQQQLERVGDHWFTWSNVMVLDIPGGHVLYCPGMLGIIVSPQLVRHRLETICWLGQGNFNSFDPIGIFTSLAL